MIDIDVLRKDWKCNSLSEKSIVITDHHFYKKSMIEDVRHGIYARSSKDWADIQSQFIQETNLLLETS